MRLVYQETGDEVRVGDRVVLRDGEVVEVTYFRPPHKPSSSGKVCVRTVSDDPADEWRSDSEYYVSVIGAEWIEREDRA